MKPLPELHDPSRRSVLSLALKVTMATLIDATIGGLGNRLAQAAKPNSVEYRTNDRQREAVAYNSNFNEAHTAAYNAFIDGISEELKNARYTMSGFETEIGKVNGLYFVLYRVKLNDAPSEEERHTVVAMRGTILSGRTPEEAEQRVAIANDNKIYTKNADGNDWKARMKQLTAHLWEEEASSSFQFEGIYWHHRAVLLKGNISE